MDQQKATLPSIKDVPAEAWQKLSQKKIYFGHQSVGYNIIDGIKDVMKENPQVKLNLLETTNPSDFKRPLFGHSKVGRNQDPEGKMTGFADMLAKGIGNEVDIALLKFCYVDIVATSDINKILAQYKTAITTLRSKYPRIRFVHLTVPLEISSPSWKTWIKKAIGKGDFWEYKDNVSRNKFNENLRKLYNNDEPIFDLATLESTYAGAGRSSFVLSGKTYYSLTPSYTDDGGHLNATGRKVVAEQLLIYLAFMEDGQR